MRILAIDLGDVRTGVAVSDKNEFLASPVGTIEEKNRQVLLKKIVEIIKKYDVKKIVLGLPKNMDGTEGDSARKSRDFKELIQKNTGLEVVLLDERGTTISAHNYLNMTDTRGKKRKNVVDTVAATIILQNYLDSKK